VSLWLIRLGHKDHEEFIVIGDEEFMADNVALAGGSSHHGVFDLAEIRARIYLADGDAVNLDLGRGLVVSIPERDYQAAGFFKVFRPYAFGSYFRISNELLYFAGQARYGPVLGEGSCKNFEFIMNLAHILLR
jgi:hypothetical protein